MKIIISKLLYFIVCFICITPISSLAFEIADILNIVGKIYGVNLDIKDFNEKIKNFNNDLVRGLTGRHDYGNNYYNPNLLSWGSQINNWRDVINMANNQGGSGELGNVLSELVKQFPISKEKMSDNDLENKYYLLQAETNLAARASSQVAFQQLKREEETIKQLHRLIDQTKDAKSSIDLSNRLASEQNRISIQEAKLLAVLVEQAAMTGQERSNHAVENNAFFDIK